jgi:hypothetical protein
VPQLTQVSCNSLPQAHTREVDRHLIYYHPIY